MSLPFGSDESERHSGAAEMGAVSGAGPEAPDGGPPGRAEVRGTVAAVHPEQPPKRSQSLLEASRHADSDHLEKIISELHALTREERFEALAAMQQRAYSSAYEGHPHPENEWYLPRLRRVAAAHDDGAPEGKAEPPHCIVGHTPHDGLFIRCGSSVVSLKVLNLLLRMVALVFLWGACAAIIGEAHFVRGGVVLDPALCIVVSVVVGGGLCRLLGVPPIIGVLAAAIVWHNVPTLGFFTAGITRETRAFVSAVGVVFILSRAGIALNVDLIRARLLSTLMLAVVPYALEGVVHAVVAYYAFGLHNPLWAAMMGALCPAVAPSIVVPGALQLLKRHPSGTSVTPLQLILAAVGIELTLSIWCFSFLSEVQLNEDASLGLLIALAPIQLVGGVAAGVAAGALVYFLVIHVFANEAVPAAELPSPTSPPGKRKQRVVHTKGHNDCVTLWAVTALCSTGLALYGAATKLSVPGGGAAAVTTLACTFGHLMTRSTAPNAAARKKEIGESLAFLWDVLVMPAVFAMAGSNIDIRDLFQGRFFGLAIGTIAAGVVGGRILGTALSCVGSGLRAREVAVVMFGWLGKATVQSALGQLPLLRLQARPGVAADKADEDVAAHQGNVASAVILKDVAILTVLLMAPIGGLALAKICPRLLATEPPPPPPGAEGEIGEPSRE